MSEPPAESPGTPKRIGVAADHGGFELKEYLIGKLREAGHEVIDFGDRQPKPEDDYPDFVVPLARAVAGGEVERGVAICGSGVGASVAANKVPGVRACLIHENFSAHQGVEDDDLNTASVSVLCYEHERTDQPAIELWNSVAPESLAPATNARDGERSALKQRALEGWENEGGEIPIVPNPPPAVRRSRDEQL